MSKPVVLVVEDDPAIRRGLVDSLRFAGYDVLECADGSEARRILRGAALDLVLLDVVLPGVTGFELLPELREQHPSLPVIMVTARGAEEDRVRGLRTGADDYVVKPFSSSELLARVEAVLRRSAERPADVAELAFDGLAVHLERREARLGDGEVRALSEREAEILRYLAARRGRAVSREELLQRVWGLDTRGIETRTVDMHVARLREKLGEDAGEARVVVTVRSKGYMLGEGVEVSSP
ncbi:MAG: response regulator transcription factor [Planctomycetota bacterium]|nr:response regulator transcription factor [Planctomycetota bacterium]MDP6761701.1 response regulator transcription factor [Planctomycetota bacterium]MDP6990185.1 response regulator transcription factor [Planctomycetota bacterium]